MPRQKTIKEVAAALEAAGGFQTQAAAILGVTQSAISHRIKKSAELQKVVEQIEARYLDVAESELMKKVKDGLPWAVCFFLKCKGKKRGYVERGEITGPDGGPIQTQSQVVIIEMPDNQRGDRAPDGHGRGPGP